VGYGESGGETVWHRVIPHTMERTSCSLGLLLILYPILCGNVNPTTIFGILHCMAEQIGIRLNGTVYLYRVGDGDVLRLWVSQQSLLPLTPTNHTVLMVGQTDSEPYTVNDYTRVPILCDCSIYTGRPIAKLTYKPTNHTIPLYPSREWLDYLHAHTPIVIHHNERFWVFTDYDSNTVQLYRDCGGRWDSTYRCWVFRELPSATPLQNTPICPLFSLLSPVECLTEDQIVEELMNALCGEDSGQIRTVGGLSCDCAGG